MTDTAFSKPFSDTATRAATAAANVEAALAEIGRVITSARNIEDVYDRFAELVRELIPFDRIVIATVDREQGTYTDAYVTGVHIEGWEAGMVHPLIDSVTEKLVVSRAGLVAGAESAEELAGTVRQAATGIASDLRSMISVPLISGNEVIGALHLRSKRANAYNEQHLWLLNRVAGQIAGAVHNAELRRMLEGEIARRDLLAEISRAAIAGLPVDALGARFLNMVRAQVAFDRGVVRVVDANTGRYGTGVAVGAGASEIPLSKARTRATTEAIALGRIVSTFDRDEDPEDPSGEGPLATLGLRSAVTLPLLSDEVVVGLVTLRRKDERGFTPSELEFLSRAAAQVAPALDNARLLDEISSLASIVESSSDLVCVMDPDGRVQYMNPSGLRMLALPDYTDVSKLTPVDLLSAEDADTLMNTAVPAALHHGSWAGELRVQRADGVALPVDALVAANYHRNGTLLGLSISLRDISERKRAEQDLRLRSAALEAAADMILITDRNGVIEFVNDAYVRETYYDKDEVVGKTPWFLYAGTGNQTLFRTIWETMLSGRVWSGELNARRKDGAIFPTEHTITPVRSAEADAMHFVMIARNISARKRAEEELNRLATTDTLTGLLNRRQFHIMLEQAIRLAVRNRTRGALIYLDLDHLKYVNDTYGHSAGDRLLKAVGNELREQVRASDVVARVGGDEFNLILYDVDARSALSKASQLVRSVADVQITADGERASSTCSVGVVVFPVDGASAEDLLTYADVAMYRAKESGRNRAQLYDPSRGGREEFSALQRTRTMILDALENHRVVVYRQPIFDIATRSVEMHEVLARLVEANGLLHAPADFIPQAETMDLIAQIDRRVLRLAMHRWREYARAGRRMRLAVNISARSLSAEMAEFIVTQADRHGVPHDALTMEITETAAFRDGGETGEFLATLSAAGFKIAIDDFGSGTTSLRQIRNLKVDFLKLDGSLVKNLASAEIDREFVRSIASLAHALGVKVVAEFVSDEETLEFLKRVGVEYAQGFYLGMPEPFPASPPEQTNRPPTRG